MLVAVKYPSGWKLGVWEDPAWTWLTPEPEAHEEPLAYDPYGHGPLPSLVHGLPMEPATVQLSQSAAPEAGSFAEYQAAQAARVSVSVAALFTLHAGCYGLQGTLHSIDPGERHWSRDMFEASAFMDAIWRYALLHATAGRSTADSQVPAAAPCQLGGPEWLNWTLAPDPAAASINGHTFSEPMRRYPEIMLRDLGLPPDQAPSPRRIRMAWGDRWVAYWIREWLKPGPARDFLFNADGTRREDNMRKLRRAQDAAKAPLPTAELRFGFELETQATRGWTCQSRVPPTEAAARTAIAGAAIFNYLNSYSVEEDRSVGSYREDSAFLTYVLRFLPKRRAEELLQAEAGPLGLDVKEDTSVQGFEFTTVGGLTLDDAKRIAIEALKPEWQHQVDEACSFHIHVSVTDHELPYSTRFQRAAWEYLAVHLDEVPTAVRARWRNAYQRDKYFALTADSEKRRFVAWRRATWEFRCFGNVSTAEDAHRCLDLAERAVRYALGRCRPRGQPGYTPPLAAARTNEAIIQAIDTDTPLAKRPTRSRTEGAA
jgi:hypothetical protein